MKKIYFIDIALLSAATAMLSVGCNPVYNFDNLSKEVTVGAEGMTAPLGGTGEITLESLLKESDDVLKLDADGNYVFGYSDSFEYTAAIGVIDPVSDIIPPIAAQTIGLFSALDTTLPNIDNNQQLSMPADLAELGDIELTESLIAMMGISSVTLDPEDHTIDNENVTIDVPAEVASLGTITFGDDGQGSPVSVRINLGKLAPITTSRTIDFALELPAGVTITSTDESNPTISKGTGSQTDNRIELVDHPFTNTEMIFDFKIASIDASTIVPVAGVLTIPFDVSYSFGMNSTIKAGTISGPAPSIAISTNLVFHSATIITGNIEQAFDFSTPVSQTVEVPKEVADIERLIIEDAATGAVPQAVVKIGITGSPVETIVIKDMTIAIPSFIDVDAPEGWTLGADNVLSCAAIDVNTSNPSTQLISLPIKGFKNLTLDTEHRIALDDDFAISGKATVATGSELNLEAGASSQIEITPEITLGDLKITSVVGHIDLDLSEYIKPQEIDLSSVSSALGDDTEVKLNLVSPDICLTVANPIGIPIEGVMTLTPYAGETAQTPVTATGIDILPADAAGNTVVTKLLVSGNPDASKEGFTLVYVEGLADIINEFPTKLVAEISMAADRSASHTLILKDEYTFNIDFDVNAALKFGADEGMITYNTVIDKIDLGDIPELGKIEKASIAVRSKSTLPMNVVLSLELQTAEGTPVEGITTSSTGTIEGSSDSTEKTSSSNITLTFADGNISAISNTKQIKCTFKASTLSGGSLNPDQYLDAKLLLVLDEGLTVDLDKLFDKSEEK